MHAFAIIVLAFLTLLSISLERTYTTTPLKELKRRARQGNELAAALVRAVGYGYSLRIVLRALIALTSAGFFVLVSVDTPLWFALVASAFLVWLGFLWLPAAQVTKFGEQLAAWLAPALGKVVSILYPMLDRFTKYIQKHRPAHVHTGLYERQDFVDLIDRQRVQADNRIEKSELDIAKHALTYGDKTISDVMTPRRIVHMISVEESVGPVFLDELYKTGFSRFPVYDGKPEHIVGTLFLKDLVRASTHGSVRDHMEKHVYYVHEDQSLHDAFQAILKTHHQLFIVVNSFEEYVGVISMEDVLEAMIGKLIVDEFDQYDDLRAVAARAARKDHASRKEPAKETAAVSAVEANTETKG